MLLKLGNQLGAFDFISSDKAIRSLVINGIIQVVIMLIIPAVLYCLMHKKKPLEMCKDFQIGKIRPSVVGVSFAAGFALFFCVIIISAFASGIFGMIGYKNPFASAESFAVKNVWTLLIVPVIMSAVLPGICEEFLNRGMLQNSLNPLSPRKAIFFSALLFACLHYNINQVVYTFFVGLLLGTITYFCKSIWPAVIMHFTNNFCATFFDYVQDEKIFGEKYSSIIDSFFAGAPWFVMIKVVLLALVAFSALAYLVHILYKMTMSNRMSYNLNVATKELLGEGIKTKNGVKYSSKTVATNETYEGETLVKLKNVVVENVASEVGSSKTYLEKLVPKQKAQPTSKLEKIFLYTSVFMTASLTFFTLIWGLL